MKKILLFLFAALVITFSGVTSGYTNQTVTSSIEKLSDDPNGDPYTYVHVYIDGKHFIYVYLGDLIWEIHEVEE